MPKHRKVDRVMRNNHRDDNEYHNNAVTLELKLGKTVAYKTSNEGLDKRTRERKKKGVKECLKVIIIKDNVLVNLKGEILGNKRYGSIYNVFLGHEGSRDSRKEGEKNNVRNTEHQDKLEEADHTLDPGV